MDQFMVDISEIPGVMEGDKVTLLGVDGTERITAEDTNTFDPSEIFKIVSYFCDLTMLPVDPWNSFPQVTDKFIIKSAGEFSQFFRGDPYYADLRPVIGSEQGGIRPVLIIQNDVGNKHSPTVTDIHRSFHPFVF